MPLPTNKSRPSLPYEPEQSLPNNQRFDLLGKKPPTAEMLDAEFNALMDDINLLAQGINEVEAGSIPGSSDILNANKVLKTDGQGNLSFVLVNSAQLAPNAVVEASLSSQSITTVKLGDGSVTSAKLANSSVQTRHLQDAVVETTKIVDGSITTPKMAPLSIGTPQIAALSVSSEKLADQAVSAPKLANLSVTADKIAQNAVTAAKIPDQSVPPSKIMPGSAPLQSVLTVTSAGNSTFSPLPFTGRIVQIQSDVLKNQSTVMGATTFTEFSIPLSVSITTQQRNSTILVILSSNIVGGYRYNSHINYPQDIYYALFKNGSLWNAAAGIKGTNQISGLGQARSTNHTHVTNISALCHETVGSPGTTNVYSFRAFNAAGSNYYVMINSQLSDGGGTTYSGIASLSSLYAIEIGS